MHTLRKFLSRKRTITLSCHGFPMQFLPVDTFSMLCTALKKIKFLVKIVFSSPCLSHYWKVYFSFSRKSLNMDVLKKYFILIIDSRLLIIGIIS